MRATWSSNHQGDPSLLAWGLHLEEDLPMLEQHSGWKKTHPFPFNAR